MDLTKKLLKRDYETTDNRVQYTLCKRQKAQFHIIIDTSLSELLAACPPEIIALILYYTIERITREHRKIYKKKLISIKEHFPSDMADYFYNPELYPINNGNNIRERYLKKLSKVHKIVILIERFINLLKNKYGIYLLKNLPFFDIQDKDAPFKWIIARQNIEGTHKTIKGVNVQHDVYDVDTYHLHGNDPDDF